MFEMEEESVGFQRVHNTLESREQVLCRVRRQVMAAKNRCNLTWDDLFQLSDKDNSGNLNFKEFKNMLKQHLKIPPQTICDYEASVLFAELDKDGTSSVDIGELFAYIQHGKLRPEDEAARLHLRIARVRKNLQIAFQRLSANEAEVRQLFKKIDMDSSNRLTKFEFNYFVRYDLKLNKWDVKGCDLDDFYNYLDKDGDGICVEELLEHIQRNDKLRHGNGPQTFYKGSAVPKAKKIRTYRQQVIDSLSRSSSLPNLNLSPPFINLGRERRPTTRMAIR